MVLTEEVLIGIAGIAITLIGFSGVVTALGRGEAGLWSPQELLQLRTLVEPSIISLFSAMVPILLAIVIANEVVIWKVANGTCFVANFLGMAAFVRRGSTGGLHASHRVGFSISVLIMLGLLAGMFTPTSWTQFTYLLGTLLGIGVSVHNFYLLLFPASKRPD